MSYRKPLIAAFLALAGTLAAGAAHAGSDIHWSIGVNLPVYPNVSVGVSSAPPVYGPRYGYGYHAPVIVAPPPVVYVPQPVYRRAVPVYAAPVYVHQPHGKWGRHDRWHRRDDRRDDRREDRHDRRHDHDWHGR
jgi:hypothetical protein